MGSNKPKINWEDSDDDFNEPKIKELKSEDENEFSELLDEVKADIGEIPLRVGQKIDCELILASPDKDDALCEVDSKRSAIIARHELLDKEGELSYAVGDKITAYVISIQNDEIVLSKEPSQKYASLEMLEEAYSARLPVKGKVLEASTKGFKISVMGRTAFCPISQISLGFTSEPEIFLGQELDFIIQKLAKRDMLVSRRSYLERQAKVELKELKEKLSATQDISIQGRVSDIKPFGAFVDFGALSGMIHISELGFTRYSSVDEKLSLGDQVTAQVLSINTDGERARIALSLRALEKDPWDHISEHIDPEKSYPAKITKLTSFGAFAEIKAGIEGLIHLSEMSWEKRIHKPEEILKVGDEVMVRVLNISEKERKISLSLKDLQKDPWYEIEAKFPLQSVHQVKVLRLKHFGALVELAPGLTGLIPSSSLKKFFGESYRKKSSPGASLEVKILELNLQDKKVLLGFGSLDDDNSNLDDYKTYFKSQEEQDKKPLKSSEIGSFGKLLQEKMSKKSKKR